MGRYSIGVNLSYTTTKLCLVKGNKLYNKSSRLKRELLLFPRGKNVFASAAEPVSGNSGAAYP